MSQPENEALLEALAFLADLSNAMTYKSHDLGYEDSIGIHWREDAADLHKKLASRAPATSEYERGRRDGLEQAATFISELSGASDGVDPELTTSDIHYVIGKIPKLAASHPLQDKPPAAPEEWGMVLDPPIVMHEKEIPTFLRDLAEANNAEVVTFDRHSKEPAFNVWYEKYAH